MSKKKPRYLVTVYFSRDADCAPTVVGRYDDLDKLAHSVRNLTAEALASDKCGFFTITIDGRGQLPHEKTAGGRKL